MAKTTCRFIPRLDAFDERCLPSVTFNEFANGDGTYTLQVVGGDATDDNIGIVESGGLVTLSDNGQVIFTSSGPVSFINVFALGGDDVVSYTVEGGNLSHSQTFKADLGAGNDTLNVALNNVVIDPNIDLLIQGLGQAGGDTFNVSATAHVSLDASLVVDLVGGKGRVRFNTDYSGVTTEQDPEPFPVDNSGVFQHTEARH